MELIASWSQQSSGSCSGIREQQNHLTIWLAGIVWKKKSKRDQQTPGRNANNFYKALFFALWARLGDRTVIYIHRQHAHMWHRPHVDFSGFQMMCGCAIALDSIFRWDTGTSEHLISAVQHSSHLPPTGAEATRALFSPKPPLRHGLSNIHTEIMLAAEITVQSALFCVNICLHSAEQSS